MKQEVGLSLLPWHVPALSCLLLLLPLQLLWAVVSQLVAHMGRKERAVRTAQFWGSHQRFFRCGRQQRGQVMLAMASTHAHVQRELRYVS